MFVKFRTVRFMGIAVLEPGEPKARTCLVWVKTGSRV
jgi:hypothetical protein